MMNFDTESLDGVVAACFGDDRPECNREWIDTARMEASQLPASGQEILLIRVGGDASRNLMLAMALSDMFPVVAMENPTYNEVGARVLISRRPEQYPEGTFLNGCGFCLQKSHRSQDEVCQMVNLAQEKWNSGRLSTEPAEV